MSQMFPYTAVSRIDPQSAKPLGNRHEQAYRAHLARVHVELVTLRIVRPTLAELLRLRGDAADAWLAEAEPVTDWEAIAEARRGR